MSNHPYGLRGDPFASPATLSAKDASRLIRRRVRAFSGDGGALFPIDTCDLIHALAGGIPDAMLELAGSALRIAAAEGASAVSPAHVRKAAESAPAAAERASARTTAPFVAKAPATRGTERAARALDALIEAAEEAVRETERDTEDAGAPAGDEHASTASADDGSDLPPFQPATIALPTRPSANLDEDTREWVLRFIPPSGAGPAAGGAARIAHAPNFHEVTPASTAPLAAAGGEPLLAGVHVASRPRRASRRHGPRRRRRSGSQGILIAVAAVCVIAFVVRMSLRGTLAPPGAEPARPTPTSAPMVERSRSVPEPPTASVGQAESEPVPTGEFGRVAAVVPEPAPAVSPPTPAPIVPAPTPKSEIAPTGAEPARREAAAGKFGLEVATFIFEERARVERERLAATGLRARVVTTLEYGSRVYRVVVGGYPHPAAAERAADSLLADGVVLQARVVRVPSGR